MLFWKIFKSIKLEKLKIGKYFWGVYFPPKFILKNYKRLKKYFNPDECCELNENNIRTFCFSDRYFSDAAKTNKMKKGVINQ